MREFLGLPAHEASETGAPQSRLKPLTAIGGDGSGAARLVEKLAAAGQLKPSCLVRMLKQGAIEQFDLGLARLLGISSSQFASVFYSHDAKGAALACRAAGIDRCAFSTIFMLSREAHGMPVRAAEMEEIIPVFATPRPLAREQLRAA